MIDYVFGIEEKTIEVCSGSVNGGCFIVDINPETNPHIVDDGQTLARIPSDTFKQESVKRTLYFSCYWAL
jgi:hypothetical protein